MRRGLAILFLCVLACGCGGTARRMEPATTVLRTEQAKPTGPELAVGVVGALRVDVPGVAVTPVGLDDPGASELVLVDAAAASLRSVAAAAAAHPGVHYALVGASAKAERAHNLVGVVLRDDEAAYLAGIAAGFSAVDQGGTSPRVAWVGPEERRLAASFERGVHAAAPGVAVLHQWSRANPARCKEAALIAVDRGATVVMAHRGVCAEAAAAGAHEQNLPALGLSDFELPSVASEAIVRDALNGVYHGGEDLVFGLASGAVGIRALDPRIPLATAARARASAQSLQNGIPPSR